MEKDTFSVQLRLRRVIYEDAYISVPLTKALAKSDGKGLDIKKFLAEGIRLGNSEGIEWKIESSTVEAHPMQSPKPDDRVV
jgi:hypothetical protein